jgi:hypothetical protein
LILALGASALERIVSAPEGDRVQVEYCHEDLNFGRPAVRTNWSTEVENSGIPFLVGPHDRMGCSLDASSVAFDWGDPGTFAPSTIPRYLVASLNPASIYLSRTTSGPFFSVRNCGDYSNHSSICGLDGISSRGRRTIGAFAFRRRRLAPLARSLRSNYRTTRVPTQS